MKHKQLEPIHGTAVAVLMAQLHYLFGSHNDRPLYKTV